MTVERQRTRMLPEPPRTKPTQHRAPLPVLHLLHHDFDTFVRSASDAANDRLGQDAGFRQGYGVRPCFLFIQQITRSDPRPIPIEPTARNVPSNRSDRTCIIDTAIQT